LVLLIMFLAWAPLSYGAEAGDSQGAGLTSGQKWWAPLSVGIVVGGLTVGTLLVAGSITLPWIGAVVITAKIALAAGAAMGLLGGWVTHSVLQEPKQQEEKQSPYRTDFFKKEEASSTPIAPPEDILTPGDNGGPIASCEQDREDCKKLCAPLPETQPFGTGLTKTACLNNCKSEYPCE